MGLAIVGFLTMLATDIYGQTEISPCPQLISSFRVPEEVVFCGNKVPLERPDVKERLEREFYYQLDKPGQLILYLKRAARCNAVMEPILKDAGVPDDLKYVPVTESALHFRAVSPVSAVGYWQFLESTAQQYGLRVDRYVDERRDLARSTKAAAVYLKKLHKKFGSWETALAAYNLGRRRVSKQVERQGTNAYYDLYLPEETDRYVFQIICFKILLSNPEAYSIRLPAEELYSPPEKETVVLRSKRWLSVDLLASSAEVSPRELRFLNPWIRRNVLPPRKYSIAVPKGQARGYKQRVAKGRTNIKDITHTVKTGESLSHIAVAYGVSIRDIEKWNNISRRRPIRPGQKLFIAPID